MKKTIGIKRIGSPIGFTKTDSKYRCELKELINADILEMIPLTKDGLCMLTDEEGYPKKLKHNFFVFFGNQSKPVQTIIGDVLFARFSPLDYSNGDPYDYELDDINETDTKIIEAMFNEELQEEFKNYFVERYGSIEHPNGYWGITFIQM